VTQYKVFQTKHDINLQAQIDGLVAAGAKDLKFDFSGRQLDGYFIVVITYNDGSNINIKPRPSLPIFKDSKYED